MKTKVALSLLLVLFLGSTVLSQTYVFQVRLKGSKKWGYANFSDNIFIQPKFKSNYQFTEEGSALVRYPYRFEIIDLSGEKIETEVIDLLPYVNLYEDKVTIGLLTVDYEKWLPGPRDYGVQSFSDGYLVVRKKKKWGCLNYKGKIVLPLKYDRLTSFNDGYALAELDKMFFVINKEGAEFPIKIAKINYIKPFSEGLGSIRVKGGKWGFVDTTGRITIAPQFKGVGYFSGGLAWARSRDGSIGYINKKGEWVIQPQFEMVYAFDPESGLALVNIYYESQDYISMEEMHTKWCYVDKNGNISFFDETEKSYEFSEGLAIGRKRGEIGFLNNKGQWAIYPQFDIALPFKNGYAAVEKDKLWGIIDKEGNWVVTPTYAEIGDVHIIE